MRTVILAALLVLVTPAGAKDDAERLNVILIMADDIGTECFSFHGGTSYSTPNLDALAAGGMRFEHCHAQPLCTPSRVKIMTGRSNVRSYVGFSLLHPDEITIGEMMQADGYATCVAGKWQLLGAEHYGETAGTGTHPRDAGFDTWCLWQVERLGSRYWRPRLDRDGVEAVMEEDVYGPDVFCDHICSFIESNRSRPFFVYYPMALVHDPFVPTPSSGEPAKHDVRHFGAMVEYMDAIVGRIVAKVDALGLRERTVIIFTSDNGTHRSVRSQTTAGRVRGGKRLTIDAGTHVPFIASCPGVVRTGTCGDLVDLSDVVPTLAAACGFALPDVAIDGVSFWPQLQGLPGTPRPWLTCYYNPRPGRAGFPEMRFARDHRWKLYADGRLFDVVADPLEKAPVVEAPAGSDAAAARAALQGALDRMPATPARIFSPPPAPAERSAPGRASSP